MTHNLLNAGLRTGRRRILHVLILLLLSIGAAAQTITGNATPGIVTFRTQITITGTNLSSSTVRVNNVAATIISNTSTTIVASLPELSLGAGVTSASVPVVVTKNAVNYAAGNVTYLVPGTVTASNKITRVISDWNGYWSSTATSSSAASQPDDHHNLTGFTYSSTIYSTGVNDASLTSNGVTGFVAGDFRSLPINIINGTTTSSTFFALGTKIDGSATTRVPTAPGVAGLKIRDVLIDGTKGLDLGTGVTNVSAEATLFFDVGTVVTSRINDAEPDIIITQIADPTSVNDVFCFLDASGNIIGTPINVNQGSVTAIGTYKVDLFNVTQNSAYADAVLTTESSQPIATRDIRMVAFKLSEFGLTAANAASVASFKIMPGGTSDTAFIAYNANALLIPSPEIVTQPTSKVACTGTGNSATFTVVATGSGLTYQWRKNGINIVGQTSASLTINNVSSSDAAAYSVVVSNSSGSVISDTVYLNTLISLQPANATTCQNSAVSLSVTAQGNTPGYQWYSNTTSSTTGGTLISGATSSSYSPPVTTVGTRYYFVVITSNGQACAAITSGVAAVTVNPVSVAGTVSASHTVCHGNTTQVTLTGYSGTIQWQQSANGTTGWAAVTGGSGATAATYTTPALTATTYYRAVVTNGTCSAATSATITITIDPVSSAGTASANVQVCHGSTATVSLTGAVGDIQWQQSANGTTGWSNVTGGSGATAASYTTPALTTTTYYRALVASGTCLSVFSDVITVTVNAYPVAGTTSGGQTICPNLTATVSVTGATGSIQWQQSANGTTGWANVTGGSGSTSASYTTPALTAGTYYRALVTNNGCTATSDVITVLVEDVFIWNGSVSIDWHTAANWSCTTIPTLAHHVIIPQTANQPVVSSMQMALAKTVQVQAGGILTINAVNNITIQGAITVAATGNIIVNSAANLLQDAATSTNSNTGNITVKRDSSPLYRQDYTLWSTPVAGQNLFQFSPQTLANRFYTYSPALDLYVAVPGLGASSTTTFTTGSAYLIRMPNANATPGYNAGTTPIVHQGQFKGVPNNGTVIVPVTRGLNGYNGVGNPYPSAINIWNFIDANQGTLDNLGTLYFWRKKNNDDNTSYAIINKTGYIRNSAEGGDTGSGTFTGGQEADWVINTGQGFIVRVLQGATGVTFNNAMRKAVNNTQFFRMANDAPAMSRYWLNLTSSTGEFCQAMIGYSDTTTSGLDYGFDGPLLNNGSIAIYTTSEGMDLSIQALGPFNADDVVPLSYRVTTAGNYAVALHDTDGLFNGQDIFIKDNLTNVIHNIKQSSYTFTSDAGTFTNRFEIVYINNVLGVKDAATGSPGLTVYRQEEKLFITTQSVAIKTLKLMDVHGRVLYDNKVNDTQIVIANLQAEEQVLLVQAVLEDGTTEYKRIIF